jgi:hypothetical protein
VVEYASDGELGTRSRVIELIGSDPGDHADEQRAELVKLVKYVHWLSLGLGSSIVDRAVLGNGEFGSLPIATELDELGHTT